MVSWGGGAHHPVDLSAEYSRPGLVDQPAKYWLVGYGLPLGYGLLVYGIVWLTGLAPLHQQQWRNKSGAASFAKRNRPPFFWRFIIPRCSDRGYGEFVCDGFGRRDRLGIISSLNGEALFVYDDLR